MDPVAIYGPQGNFLKAPELELATRKGRHIPNKLQSARAPESLLAAQSNVLGAHSSARGRSLSNVYNCMGMVFASRRTWIEPEHLETILEDDEYQPVPNEGELRPGDVVVYRDHEDYISHVGIVAEVRPNIREATREIFVLSQWGQDGEYFHLAEDVNPLLGRPAEYWTDRI